MTLSLPSKKIVFADIPEVSGFTGTFYYNFFSPDERVTDTGNLPVALLEKPSEQFNSSFIETMEFTRVVPRYIEFNWKPLTVGHRHEIGVGTSIRQHYNDIIYEHDLATDDYSVAIFQDTNADLRFKMLTAQAISMLIPHADEIGSPQDLARVLNSVTNEEIRPDFLSAVLNNSSTYGSYFFTDNVGDLKEIPNETFELLKRVRMYAQLNNKVVADSLATIMADPVSPFADEFTQLMSQAGRTQEQVRTTRNSTLVTADDYDTAVPNYVTYRPIEDDLFEATMQPIGYIIEKEELTSNGAPIVHDPLIVESPAIATTIDIKVKYGAKYRYYIRAIAYIEVQVYDVARNENAAAGFLLSSKKSPAIVVDCEETLPPPPPADFNVSWDFADQCARLLWSFPVNTQRDTKKFQIFRRPSIYQSFELIKMYDFDDSVIKSGFSETPDSSLVELTSAPQAFYLDKDFTRESSYIYALCCVDAHGYSSNYSMQYEATFDKFGNKLKIKMVSIEGAPKAYPNMYLNIDTFVDTIKDEGHSKLTVIFNPEYLEVTDSTGAPLNLLKTGANDFYRLQLINVDLQQQQVLNIKLDDRRRNQEIGARGIIRPSTTQRIMPIDDSFISNTTK